MRSIHERVANQIEVLLHLYQGTVPTHINPRFSDADGIDPIKRRFIQCHCFGVDMVKIDLTGLPEEVIAYGFDQLESRVSEGVEIPQEERYNVNYDESVFIETTPATDALRKALMEKVRDLEREIDHGERDDFTASDIRVIRRRINKLFD